MWLYKQVPPPSCVGEEGKGGGGQGLVVRWKGKRHVASCLKSYWPVLSYIQLVNSGTTFYLNPSFPTHHDWRFIYYNVPGDFKRNWTWFREGLLLSGKGRSGESRKMREMEEFGTGKIDHRRVLREKSGWIRQCQSKQERTVEHEKT